MFSFTNFLISADPQEVHTTLLGIRSPILPYAMVNIWMKHPIRWYGYLIIWVQGKVRVTGFGFVRRHYYYIIWLFVCMFDDFVIDQVCPSMVTAAMAIDNGLRHSTATDR